MNKKQFFLLLILFAHDVLFEGTFTSFYKDKSRKEKKTVEKRVFQLFLLDDGRIQMRTVPLKSGSGNWRLKT